MRTEAGAPRHRPHRVRRRGGRISWEDHGRAVGVRPREVQDAVSTACAGVHPRAVWRSGGRLSRGDGPTAAVILKPIQGENGVILPPEGYLAGVRRICDQQGALLILDEVQTGLGRTGRMFACEHWGVVPDLLTMAKALGGGVMPIGAFTGRPALWKVLETNPYLHSSTFGGNPLACAAGLATIRVIQDEHLVERAADLGGYLMARLEALARRHPGVVKQVRGKGLLIGVEFTDPDIVLLVTAEALQPGVIVFYSLNNPSTFRIAPPLVISRPQLDRAVEALEEAVAAAETLLAEMAGEVQAPS